MPKLPAKRTWAPPLIALALLATALPAAKANGDEWSSEGYRYYPPTPQEIELARAYVIDPVNRRSSLTPEPVWRSMFPGIHERMMAEYRVFGRAGQVDREYRYWRRYR